MAVVGSELAVLKMVKGLGKGASTSAIGRKLKFSSDYVGILIKSLVKGGYVAKAGRSTYKLTSKGKVVLKAPEVPEVKKGSKRPRVKKRPKRLKVKKKPKRARRKKR